MKVLFIKFKYIIGKPGHFLSVNLVFRYPECLLNKFWHDNQLIEQIIPTLEKEKLTTKTVLKQMNGDDVKAVTTTIGQRILLQQIIDKLVEKDDIDHVE